MASVTLRSVYKAFGEVVISKDVNLTIDDGEFVVFVGPSGCGKSTLLRMIAGLEDITSGDLFIGEKRMNEVPPSERGIGMVFQSYALYPHLSVADNMSFGLKLAGAKKAEINQRVNQVSEVLQLAHLLDRRPKALSGGQRQRVAMGRAIVRDPAVFLMDEPLSNLDAKLRVQMRAEISSVVHNLGTTTVYVTHDQIEAMTMGDRMAVMKAGFLQQAGAPQEVYDHPNNIFVAQFVGSPPMNLVMGKVLGEGDSLSVQIGSGQIALPASVLEQRPALRSYAGKQVVLGVRSEDMEDANLSPDAPADRRISGEVILVEALGSEIVVHFSFAADPVVTDDTKLMAEESGETLLDSGGEVHWVASFAPRSRVRRGDNIEIVVDTERVHWFDPQTSEAIRG